MLAIVEAAYWMHANASMPLGLVLSLPTQNTISEGTRKHSTNHYKENHGMPTMKQITNIFLEDPPVDENTFDNDT